MSRAVCRTKQEVERTSGLILRLIQEKPMTRHELCQATGVSLTRVDYHLGVFRDLGQAESTVCGPMGARKWSAHVVAQYDLDNHMPEYLGQESIFHVGMTLSRYFNT